MMKFLKVTFFKMKFMWQDIEQEEEFLAQEMSHVSHKATVLLQLQTIVKKIVQFSQKY